MNQENLNAYSRAFYEHLLVAKPEWGLLAEEEDDKNATRGSLVIKIESPNPEVENPLCIYTDNDEVTIVFDTYHQHFGMWDREISEDNFCEAIMHAEDILSDNIHAVSWYDANTKEWAGSSCVERDKEADRSFLKVKGPVDEVRRSWTGKYDQSRRIVGDR